MNPLRTRLAATNGLPSSDFLARSTLRAWVGMSFPAAMLLIVAGLGVCRVWAIVASVAGE